MEENKSLNMLRDALIKLREEGKSFVHIRSLENFLDEQETDAIESDKDQQLYLKFRHETILAVNIAKWDFQKEGVRATINSGQVAMRAAIMINGGAAVAILAFLGHLVSVNSSEVSGIANAMFAYIIGVLCATLSTGSNYCSAYVASSDKKEIFYFFNIISILLIIGSYSAFFIGGYCAYNTLISWS